jgi:MSHA pilin protein MshA
MRTTTRRSIQSGFTLIELIVVIVVLAILAATALPRFVDMSADARIAKMRAGQAAMQTGASLFHAAWLAAGSPTADPTNSTNVNSTVLMEGARVAFINGYPDVGGDGSADANNALATLNTSGILVSAGGLSDYVVVVATAPDDPRLTLVLTPDANHPNCNVTYTQATVVGGLIVGPAINAANLTKVNCT